MDQEQLTQLVEKVVLATMADNEEFIIKGLAKDLAWEDGWEHTVSRAAMNSVTVSTKLSVQIVLDLLLKTGIFKISEEITRPQLTVIRGGVDPESPVPQSPK